MYSKLTLLALAIAVSANVSATNLIGDTTNNNQTYNQPSANANGGSATSIANGGTGGQGGDATAYGGTGLANASVGDVRNTNTNTALGGQGGTGIGLGGSAAQGQQQGQGQQQSNVGINGQDQHQSATAVGVNGQKQSNENTVDASSQNDNRSTASGNTTNVGATTVGGQKASNTTNVSTSYVSERNAPPVYLGQLTATMSCSGSFQAGGSQTGGSGAFGFTWISGDCRSVVAADKFRELGMVDTACKILKTTKGFKRAAARDRSLANVDCTAK